MAKRRPPVPSRDGIQGIIETPPPLYSLFPYITLHSHHGAPSACRRCHRCQTLCQYWQIRPTVRVRPDQFPILCSSLYNGHEYGWDWDQLLHYQEEASVLSSIVAIDDVPAIQEMLRLMGPELLYWDDRDYAGYSPTMISAAGWGSVRVLKALLDYRDNPLTSEHHEAIKEAQKEYEWRERFEGSNMARAWGTLLTKACMCAQVDVVRLLLDRMPEVDINACDKFGYTPLQAVARHSERTAQALDSHNDKHNYKLSIQRMTIVRLLLGHGANKKAPETSFERVGQTVKDASNASPDNDDPDNNLRPLVYRPGGIGNALIMALTRPASVDVLLTRILINEVDIDVHEGYFFATAAFDGRGQNSIADDVDVDGFQRDRDAAYKKFTADFDADRDAAYAALTAAVDAANAAERLLLGPGQGPDTYLTPLAAAALFRNPTGVVALLETPGADFYTDLVSPSILTHMSRVGNATVTTMRPLHAAMIGRRCESLRPPFFHEPEYYRDGALYSDAAAAEGRAAVKERDGLPDNSLDRKLEIQAAKELAKEDKLYPRASLIRQSEDARKIYLEDCVNTVKLLTADPDVCAATINATHLHEGLEYTPLHLGARFDRLPMLRVLLDAVADPHPPVPHTRRGVFFSVFASLLPLCANTGRSE